MLSDTETRCSRRNASASGVRQVPFVVSETRAFLPARAAAASTSSTAALIAGRLSRGSPPKRTSVTASRSPEASTRCRAARRALSGSRRATAPPQEPPPA